MPMHGEQALTAPTEEADKNQSNAPETEQDIPEISPEQEVRFVDQKEDFEKFFSRMKRYRQEDWTLMKIEAQSQQLQPLIREFREILELGGAANANHLLEALVEAAQSGKTKEKFWDTVSDRSRMLPGSDLDRFYRFFVKGLEMQTQEQKEAA